MSEQIIFESTAVESAHDIETDCVYDIKVAAVISDDGARVRVGTLEFTVAEARAVAAALIVAASCASLEI